jgi:hypothetical protein
MLANCSALNFVLGLLVLIGVFSIVYWASGKLAAVRAVPSPSLKDHLAAIAESGKNEGILLIGPPRGGKDSIATAAVNPVRRISLLDANLSDVSVKKEMERINALIVNERDTKDADSSRRKWIHVSNLESQLVSADRRMLALQLLEKLVEHSNGEPRKGVIVTSSVDPIGQFKEIFEQERRGIYTDAIPEVELSRCSLLLTRFRRCYLPLGGQMTSEQNAIGLWNSWLNYDPQHWSKTAQLEEESCDPLSGLVGELRTAWADRTHVRLEELVRAIRAKAQAYYELLWTSCTRSEKLVLIQLAQEGFINPKSRDVVTQLIAKGLITERPAPTIFNYTFRAFLREIERDYVVQEWEGMEGNGLWVLAGRLVASTLVAGGLFFLLTQDFSVQSLLPIISGSGFFGVPLVRDLLARLSTKTGATASA